MYLVLGLVAGVFSGIMGVGGGIILIPALVYIFGYTQHEAQGTTLAVLVPPIGLLAAWMYYKQGFVNIGAAALICAAFFIGGFFGAKMAVGTSADVLKRVFGALMFAIGIKMMFFK